jgi:ADP-ribose pyrophosphatase YjhB (NUDIX family)
VSQLSPGTRSIRVAANAVIVRDGRVLLVEFSGGTKRAHFNFPGGGVELGETLEEAVRREVREETCLDVSVVRLLLIVESVALATPTRFAASACPGTSCAFSSSARRRTLGRSPGCPLSQTARKPACGG